MSCPSNYLIKFPNEILQIIFRHLDARSLNMAGHVCKRWSEIVQIFHDKAWRSLTKAVMLKAEIIRPKYQSIGWVEQEHMWNTCNCIDIARELVPYEDNELLVHDMEVGESIKYKTSDGEDNMEIYRFEVAEAVSRLAAASIINSIDGLEVEFFLEDLSSVKNISHLVRIVKDGIYLDQVTIKDFSTFFSHICCKTLEFFMHTNILTDKDIDSLTEVLNNGVEKFQFMFGHNLNFPYIKNYDGRGKCHEINFEYRDDDDEDDADHELFESDLPKIQEWASSRGWTVEVINDTPHTDLFESQIISLRRN